MDDLCYVDQVHHFIFVLFEGPPTTVSNMAGLSNQYSFKSCPVVIISTKDGHRKSLWLPVASKTPNWWHHIGLNKCSTIITEAKVFK